MAEVPGSSTPNASQLDELEHSFDLGAIDGRGGSRELWKRPQQEVLLDREVAEDAGHLQHEAHPQPRALVRRQTGDVDVAEADRPAVGLQPPIDEVEQAALPGPVRPDQASQLTTLQLQRQVVDRDEPSEALRQPLDGEDGHVSRSRLRNPKMPEGSTRITATRMIPTTTSQMSRSEPDRVA